MLFRQGDVHEHTELSWLLSSVTAVGELNRMHQFRDKSLGQRDLVSAALLFYPVLQAADVLAYRAHEVPVGEDQREHIELMRDVARRFNARFGEDILVIPEHRIPEVGGRIMDLQEPTNKMSTTGGTARGDRPRPRRARDDREEDQARGDRLRQRHRARRRQAGRDEPHRDPRDRPRDDARGGRGRRCARRAATATSRRRRPQAVVEMLAPLQERYADLRGDEQRLEEILAEGAEKARAMARETLADVREAMGVGRPRS